MKRVALVVAGLACASYARAEEDVRWIEPHVALAPYGPPGHAGRGVGLGARGGYVFAPEGFAPTLDDAAAITVGVDVVRYRLDGSLGTRCNRFVTAVDGQTQICVDADAVGGGDRTVAFVPVSLEWSVRPTPALAVLAELGLALAVDHGAGVAPVLGVGLRWRLADRVQLAARIGYPVWTVGIALPF